MREIKVIDAKFRIKKFLEKYNGKIYLSFSGGKDSTVLSHLIQSVQEEYDFNHAPFVFCNTGLELPFTIEFVKKYAYDNMVIVSPKVKFTEVFERYGRPTISKEVDDRISTYQNFRNKGYSKEDATDPSITRRGSLLVGKHPNYPHFKLSKKNIWVLDTEIKISNKCCDKLKKDPLNKYAKDNDMEAVFLGVRTSESRMRKSAYKSCFKQTKKIAIVTPIYDWRDEDIETYIEDNNIEISKCYTEMNFTRTGCHLCPYNKNIIEDLEVIKKFHPKLYFFIWGLMSDIYENKICKSKEEQLKLF